MNIIITRMNRSECAKQLEAALARIEELEGRELTPFGRYRYDSDKIVIDRRTRYLAAMDEAGKDYVYLKKSLILPYELGDALFNF